MLETKWHRDEWVPRMITWAFSKTKPSSFLFYPLPPSSRWRLEAVTFKRTLPRSIEQTRPFIVTEKSSNLANITRLFADICTGVLQRSNFNIFKSNFNAQMQYFNATKKAQFYIVKIWINKNVNWSQLAAFEHKQRCFQSIWGILQMNVFSLFIFTEFVD